MSTPASLTTDSEWSTESPVSPGSTVMRFDQDPWQVATIFIGALGFVGNAFVVVVMLSSRAMRGRVTNIHLINQGVVDALASLLLAAFALTSSDGVGLSSTSYADQLLCRLWLTRFPVWGTVMSSTYSLLALTVDRYFRIVHPILYRKHFNRWIMGGTIAFAWIFGLLYNFAWEWPTSDVVNGQCLAFAIWPSPMTARVVGITTVSLQYFVPLLTFVVCYSRIISVIHRRVEVAPESAQPAVDSARVRGGSFRRALKNTVKTLILVAVSFVLCWTFNELFIFMYFLGYPADFAGSFYKFSVVAVFSNSCINPLIYLTQYDDFKSALSQLFSKTRVSEFSVTTQMTVDRY